MGGFFKGAACKVRLLTGIGQIQSRHDNGIRTDIPCKIPRSRCNRTSGGEYTVLIAVLLFAFAFKLTGKGYRRFGEEYCAVTLPEYRRKNCCLAD